MRVTIDPPARRALTPNEQRVYKLLRDGMEPIEIAKKLHMSLQCSNLVNRYDVPPDTIMGLIASIREKGWDTSNTKEENIMPRGEKTPVGKLHEISFLRDEGKSYSEIAKITGVSFSTVRRTCMGVDIDRAMETKEEPAPTAIDTSSQNEITSINSIAEIPADVNPADEIAGSDGFCCEVTGDTDMEAYMAERERDLAAPKKVPAIVLKISMEKREELYRKISAAESNITEWYKEIDEISAFLAENTVHFADEEGRE